MIATRRSPRQLIEGEGTVSALGPVTAQLGRRALVVTDPVIVEQPGFATALRSLEAAGVDVHRFVDAVSDVPLEVVDRCAAVAAEVDPQVIVGIGGGTVLDLAKVVALVHTHGGSPRDYYGENRVPGPVLPMVAVPTTAGTGSEVTTVSVLSDDERELKVGISSVHLVPDFAICDPQLTHTCPPSVTAFAGIDAMCHAVEAYTAAVRPAGWEEVVHGVSIGKNDFADHHALRAVTALGDHLARAVEDGQDREARAAVMRGATDAGVAFSHAGTAAPHALQYPVGAATKTPHGLGVGLFLPYVLTANRPGIDPQLLDLARAVGLDDDDPDAFIAWIVDLDRRIGVPSSLQDIGVERTQLRGLAELAATVTRLLQNNPGDNSVEGLERVLAAAWEGDRDLLR